jgi:hypothetical protein
VKPPDDAPQSKPPVSPIDRDIADAFAALDRTAPDRPQGDFSARVLARLGDGAGAESPPRPARPAPDDSGLHDIVALASEAKRRLSERDQSESDAGESVMLTAAPGGLRAVSLSEAGRAAAAPAAEMRVPREPTRTDSRSSLPFWLLGSVATVAAAAAVAVFVFGIGRHKEHRQEATELARVETPPPAPGAVEPPAGGTAAPSAVAPGTAATGGLAGAGQRDEVGADERAEPRAKAERVRPAPREQAREEHGSKERAEARKHLDEKKQGGAAAPEATRPPHSEAEGSAGAGAGPGVEGEPGAKPAAGGGDVDLGDMLDSVADEDKPASARRPDEQPKQVEKQKDEPAKAEKAEKAEKKELERGQVSRALEDIHGQVQSCRDAEQFIGTVTVKFMVAPSGQVTSAAATGAHSGSRTGACVARAVRQARFPTFDGVPISFTYPFLLSR